MHDEMYMARALKLAARGRFTTHPNPRVGCVIVNQGEIVGEGFHYRAGEPHAEVHAGTVQPPWPHAAVLRCVNCRGCLARGCRHAGS